MKKTSVIICTALVTYFVSWTVVYGVIMQGDFRYYRRYLQLAWTSPGEIPTMIQLVALVCTAVVVIIAWFYFGKKRNY
jgi:hypothetical protein